MTLMECRFLSRLLIYLSNDYFTPLSKLKSCSSSALMTRQQNITSGAFTFADYAIAKWMDHFLNVCKSAERLLRSYDRDVQGDRDAAMQELEETADEFIHAHDDETTERHDELQTIDTSHPINISTNKLCDAVSDGGQNIRRLLKHVIRLRLSPVSRDERSFSSLNESFTEARQEIEALHSNTNTYQSLVSELHEYYGEKLYKCERLSCYFFHEGFTDRNTREKHKRRHERPYQCEIPDCSSFEFGFTNKVDLDKHTIAFHPDAAIKAIQFKPAAVVDRKEWKHRCTQCDRTFARRNILKDHELAHAGQKPHECPTCGKAFTRKNDCVRHERIHNNRVRR